MAYVLGFFAADGCMTQNKRGGHFIEFHITDKDILEKMQLVLGSDHKISVRKRNDAWKKAYRLQIGSKEMFQDLLKLGMTPQKSSTLNFPQVPKGYLADFVRGYFDGDGNVYANRYQRKGRKKLSRTLLTGFTSGSRDFLEELDKNLKEKAGILGGSLFSRKTYFRLHYSVTDSCKLYQLMYNDKNALFLMRKKDVFEGYFFQRQMSKVQNIKQLDR